MRKKRTFQTKRMVMAAGAAAFAAVLAGGALHATAKEGTLAVQELPDASFTEADYDKLRALQFDGYEDMTVRAYQTMAWQRMDKPEYRDVLERMSGSSSLQEKMDEDALAHFLFYVLEPLTAERWQTRSFGGYTQETLAQSGQTAMVEYNYTLTITDADALTVGAYREAQEGIVKGMGKLLSGRSAEELADVDSMQVLLDEAVAQLKEQWSSDALEIDVEYCFQPVEPREEEEDVPGEDEEPRSFPYGSGEDYRSLLALKTPDYQDLPVATFNRKLLEWANENYERMERISEDTGRNDFQVKLGKAERDFVTRTVLLSGKENGRYVQSSYTGRRQEDVCYQEYLPTKGGGSAWCDLYYMFTYHITDKKELTVGERDRCVGGMIDDVREFWKGTDVDVLLSMKKADVVDMLQQIAIKNSEAGLLISVNADDVSFEPYDERGGYDRLVSYRTKGYEKMSVADFNARLCDEEGELDRLLDANAQVTGTISREDENYDFLVNTMSVSLSELYCEVFGETYGIASTLSKLERPYDEPQGDETIYAFAFFVNGWISYTIDEPELLTVEARNRALQAMQNGLQSYVDGLSEEELMSADIERKLVKKGEELAGKLSTDRMKIWYEVQLVER